MGIPATMGMAALPKREDGGVVMRGDDRSVKTWGKSRSVRLKGADYSATGRAYHVIIGSRHKQFLFVEESVSQKIIHVLMKACELHGFRPVAYCLMPDHLHILVQSEETSTSLPMFVRAFKSFASRAARRRLWQRGYYEHIMRSDESLITTAEYIVNNPVRRGLVQRREDYRWSWCIFEERDL
jgi:REP element-mobilizing transposase RayT